MFPPYIVKSTCQRQRAFWEAQWARNRQKSWVGSVSVPVNKLRSVETRVSLLFVKFHFEEDVDHLFLPPLHLFFLGHLSLKVPKEIKRWNSKNFILLNLMDTCLNSNIESRGDFCVPRSLLLVHFRQFWGFSLSAFASAIPAFLFRAHLLEGVLFKYSINKIWVSVTNDGCTFHTLYSVMRDWRSGFYKYRLNYLYRTIVIEAQNGKYTKACTHTAGQFYRVLVGRATALEGNLSPEILPIKGHMAKNSKVETHEGSRYMALNKDSPLM